MVKQSIIPAIIPISYVQLEDRLREVRGVVRSVQIDVMDGTYTDTTSWPYVGSERDAFEALRREDKGLPYWQEFDFEIDLMVHDPLKHIERWALAGTARVILHVESTDTLGEAITACKRRRLEVGIALKPSTPIEVIAPFISDVVFVQCMGSDSIGRHGVPLDDAVFQKVRSIITRWPELLVGVDIGVNERTIAPLYAAGARRFVAGSAVFELGAPIQALRTLQGLVTACESA